ncbi:Protein of unknown function [Leuconostoc citreum LBAE E16]|nr:Protein of unknown function [Leuconostoc citreum LBAE E16]
MNISKQESYSFSESISDPKYFLWCEKQLLSQ